MLWTSFHRQHRVYLMSSACSLWTVLLCDVSISASLKWAFLAIFSHVSSNTGKCNLLPQAKVLPYNVQQQWQSYVVHRHFEPTTAQDICVLTLCPLCICVFCLCRVCSPLPLVHVLRQIVTRHTKDQELEGRAVLQLPNKTVTNIPGVLHGTYHALVCLSCRVQSML